MNNLAILQDVDAEYSHQVECLRFRHKKANDIYKLIVFLLVLGLSVSLYSWGLDVWAQHRADQQTEDARKVWSKELADKEAAAMQAQAEAEKAKETSLDAEAETLAKAFYGIHLFIDKYHYTDSDLETYARCIFNRYGAGNGLNSIHEGTAIIITVLISEMVRQPVSIDIHTIFVNTGVMSRGWAASRGRRFPLTVAVSPSW